MSNRIVWVEADLATWMVPPEEFDLVVCLYVHAAGGAVEAMVRGMAKGVALGGVLLFVRHLPVDPITGATTAAAGQVTYLSRVQRPHSIRFSRR